jgi:hypothetical protein
MSRDIREYAAITPLLISWESGVIPLSHIIMFYMIISGFNLMVSITRVMDMIEALPDKPGSAVAKE